ncbi:MAG: sulfotransferase family 2 domain-containing protein [Anaerolineae bacterium]|nr:sulfotransferase family 2 domain-containing protein [Anaerolineae bacterium]
MIISHKHKFIFIKTKKTAGTSIEIALSKFCGDEDVITPITPADERTRSRLGYRGPQNYLPLISDDGSGDAVNAPGSRQKKCRFINHSGAKKIRRCIGEDEWNSYYKFCFERNPWDRFISLYYWRCRSEPRLTISAFLDTDIPLNLKRRGINLYTIAGEIAVDRVCLYENLTKELENIRQRLGLPEKLELPRAKAAFRTDRRSYREILNEEQAAKIGALFSQEIGLFNYEF